MVTHRPLPPRDYCKKLLPVAIDEIARADPTRPWASLPVDDWDLAKGFEDVSFGALARAVDRLAHALDAAFGRLPPSSSFETFAYIGVPDVRYHMVQVAAVKTRRRVLLSSPLNSTNIHLSLMQSTGCVALLSARGVAVDDILRGRPGIKHATVADLDDLLLADDAVGDSDDAGPYPFDKSWEEGAFDPYMVIHSSGTTADPKPVEYKHLYYGNAWTHVFLPDVGGRPHFHRLLYPGDGTRFLLAGAPWHVMSAACALQMSIFGRGIFCPGYRHRAVGTEDICDFLAHADVRAAALTPWMMEAVASRPEAHALIGKMDAVLFGGAVLSKFASSTWAKYTHIQNAWGATEAMATGILQADREDHEYVYFDTVNTGIVFRESKTQPLLLSSPDPPPTLYEAVLTMDERTAPYAPWHARQGITPENTPPPYPEYATGDLWTPHPDPSKSTYAFRFVGRTDDTFTLSSASNIHPGPVEAAIGAHPRVRGVLVVGGDRRRQPAVLIESDGGEADADDIWEAAVRPTNEHVPAHATLRRSHVVVVPCGSFVRTPTGKIARRRTEAALRELVDRVYREFGDDWQGARQGRFRSITATTEIKVEVSETDEVG